MNFQILNEDNFVICEKVSNLRLCNKLLSPDNCDLLFETQISTSRLQEVAIFVTVLYIHIHIFPLKLEFIKQKSMILFKLLTGGSKFAITNGHRLDSSSDGSIGKDGRRKRAIKVDVYD